MISVSCVHCGQSIADTSLLVCYSCRDAVRDALADIDWWFDEMLSPPVKGRGGRSQITDSTGETWEGDNPRLGVAVKRLPMDDNVGSVRLEILEILLGWAALHQERTQGPVDLTGVREWHRGNLRELVAYLAANEQWLLTETTRISDEHVAAVAEGYVPEVIKLASLAQRTGAPNRREGVAITVHQVEDDLGGLIDCGTVWAKHINGDGRCATCGCRRPTAEWHQLYPSLPEDPLTDQEAAAYVTVTYGRTTAASTIAVWRHRGSKADPPKMAPSPKRRLGRIATPRHALDEYIQSLGLKTAV